MITAHPACPVRGIHRPQYEPKARRKSARPRLPIHFGFWRAVELAPRDFIRLERALGQGKEATS